MKNVLGKLIEQAYKSGGEVYVEENDILVTGNLYIDERTVLDEKRQINIVRPVVFLNGAYFYCCPDCCRIHHSHNLGKIQTGCCLDIDCERHQYFKGNHYLIKRNPIILDDEMEDM